MEFSRKAFIGRVAAISWSVAVANFSLEQRVFCLGCAEISLILSFYIKFLHGEVASKVPQLTLVLNTVCSGRKYHFNRRLPDTSRACTIANSQLPKVKLIGSGT